MPVQPESMEMLIYLDDPEVPVLVDRRHAEGGMMGSVPTAPQPALMHTSAPNAATPATSSPLAPLLPRQNYTSDCLSTSSLLLHRPAYVRDLFWTEDEAEGITLAGASLTMPPLPPVPFNELRNHTALTTIRDNPALFVVSTPINIPAFRTLLSSHPNQSLVQSVCRGLEFGFWPWANTDGVILPDTFDDVYPLRNPAHLLFALSQRDIKISERCFSHTFDTLLPGMLAVPVTISERNPTKFRLCVDHSADPYSRNALIPKSDVSVPLDNLHLLGRILRELRITLGSSTRIVLFKSDVSRAYRTLPMHPLWQIKQVVKIGDSFNVDWRNNYGSRAAGGIWGAFFALVIWIAIYVKFLSDLFAYVDDGFSWELKGNLLYYAPYDKFLPAKQTRLLLLWDELGIPHSEAKQVWGATLTIIGMEVDANAMTITMPLHSRDLLLDAIRSFAILGVRCSLREFQKLGGWINWALNVFPLLRPGICQLYHKIGGKSHVHAKVIVNATIVRELTWLADHMAVSNGIFLLDSVDWPISIAHDTLFTDASNVGLGFWCPGRDIGFYHEIEDDERGPGKTIFYFEALAVLSALRWITRIAPWPQRLVIYTDNHNTVDIFHSLRASPAYNPMLLKAIDILLLHNAQLRILHIAGDDNCVADALSRLWLDLASQLAPGICILPFTPPHVPLGAVQR